MFEQVNKILSRNIHFCDVGARWGISEPWKDLIDNIDLVYFEPDKEEFEMLKKRMRSNDKGYDCALYSESIPVDLNLMKARECSSILQPNISFLNRFPQELLEMYEIEKVVSILARSIDDIYASDKNLSIDFIKLDVQGAELDILKGGKSFLENSLIGAEIEVEFQPLYKDQPLFSDLDIYIRNNTGLELYDLTKHFCKYRSGEKNCSKKGQMVFGDALYLRSPFTIIDWCNRFDKKEAANKIISACVTGMIYGYLDYSLTIIKQKGIEDILDVSQIKKIENVLVKYSKSLNLEFRGSNRISAAFSYLERIFQRTHKGWASSEGRLGTRKTLGIFN